MSSALQNCPVDGTLLSDGQIVGLPIAGGVSQLNGVGLFNTGEAIAMASQIDWAPEQTISAATTLSPSTPA